MSNARDDTLIDNFGRRVTYVRLSVTDRCDLRCVYCMSEDMTFLPRDEVLTLEEIAQVAQAFTELGVNKIRLTGGEPLVRRGIDQLIQSIGQLPGLKDFTITTNGTQLRKYASAMAAAGLSRINVSLDTLSPERFKTLSRVGNLDAVLDGIAAAQSAGFRRIKLNAVILKGQNDDEVLPLVDFAIANDLDISFIEEMPLGVVSGRDRSDEYCSSDDIKSIIETRHPLMPSSLQTGGPSKYWAIPGQTTRVGFISPHSHNFCDTCNRVRVTVQGRLLLCLGQEHSVDLRETLRAFPGDMARLKQAIRESMAIKPQGHEFSLTEQPIIFRHMSTTGG